MPLSRFGEVLEALAVDRLAERCAGGVVCTLKTGFSLDEP